MLVGKFLEKMATWKSEKEMEARQDVMSKGRLFWY
jgi:hypothetical protein